MSTLSPYSCIGFAAGQPGGTPFQAHNPANGDAFGPMFHSALPQEVDTAANLAQQASTTYGSLPGERRAEFLEAIATQIEAAIPELVQTTPLETGLPAGRIQMESGRTMGQLRMFASLIRTNTWLDARIDAADPSRQPLPKPDVRSMAMPRGPVVVFGASNFPLAFSVAGGDTASALAAGCPVIVKAHPAHPATSAIVARAILNAATQTHMPNGVFSMLFDAGHHIGKALVQHPHIKAVGFTGSRRGGRTLMDLAAYRPEPIPVFAEMSSINPLIILPEATAQKGASIAEGLANSITLGVGQFCTCPGLILLPVGAAGDALLLDLSARLEAHTAAPMLTHGIGTAYTTSVRAVASQPGVAMHVPAEPSALVAGRAALLATNAQHFLAQHALQEEMFGPAALVVQYASTEELLLIVSSLEGQLTATIHGTDSELQTSSMIVAALSQKSGRIVFNGYPTGVEVCHAMVHGGPYPATSDGASTSVGTAAIHRFTRRVCFQNAPSSLLPPPLRG